MFEIFIGDNIRPCVVTHSFGASSLIRMCFQLRDGLFGLFDFLLNVLGVFLLKPALSFVLGVLVTAAAIFRRFGRLFVLPLFLFANKN